MSRPDYRIQGKTLFDISRLLSEVDANAVAWAKTLSRWTTPQDGRQPEIDKLVDLAARARVAQRQLQRLASTDGSAEAYAAVEAQVEAEAGNCQGGSDVAEKHGGGIDLGTT